MHIITESRLREFWRIYPDSESSLRSWYKLTKQANWLNLVEIRRVFPAADLVGNLTVFNISGNKYRLIAKINYKVKRVYIRAILTHKEYDEQKWKQDSWY